MIWKSVIFSDKSHKNHEHPKIIIEKTAQIEKRCRHPHQTDFPSRIPRSQKPRNSKGFCEDNLLCQMAEQNSQGRGMGDTATSSNPRPSRAVIRFLLTYQIRCWLLFQHMPPADKKAVIISNTKEDAAHTATSSDQSLGSVIVYFLQDFE